MPSRPIQSLSTGIDGTNSPQRPADLATISLREVDSRLETMFEKSEMTGWIGAVRKQWCLQAPSQILAHGSLAALSEDGLRPAPISTRQLQRWRRFARALCARPIACS